LAGASSPFDPGLSSAFRHSTGVDVSHGRTHTDPAAQQACADLGVQGFALGDRVAFASPHPSPGLALHEYAHVGQQTGVAAGLAQGDAGLAPAPSLEVEADQVASSVLRGQPAHLSLGAAPQVQGKAANDDEPAPAPASTPPAAEAASTTTTTSPTATPTGTPSGTSAPAAAAPTPAAEMPKPDPKVVEMLAPLASPARQELLTRYSGDLDKITDLLSTGFSDWAITDSDANKVMRQLEAVASVPERAALVNEIARRGKLADLWSNLSDGSQTKYPKAYLTLVVHGAAGAATPDVAKGIVQSDPTPFAAANLERTYFMNSVPNDLITKEARQQATGATSTVTAWIAVIEEPVRSRIQQVFDTEVAKAKVVEQEDKPAREERAKQQETIKAASTTAMEKDPSFRDSVNSIKDLLSYAVFDWVITDKEATKVFNLLKEMRGDPSRIQQVIYQLDQGPFVERFLSNVPEDVRWGDPVTFLAILTARAPEKNVGYAKELLTRGVFDWAITDAEASLAFQLAKSMPSDIQRQFREADNGKWWSRMEGELAEEKQGEKGTHFYRNTEEVQQLKLSFQKECARMPLGQLTGQIEMLMIAGEVDFVETTMAAAGLDKNPELGLIYLKYGLAKSGTKRDEAAYQKWKAGPTGAKVTAADWGKGLLEAGEMVVKGVALGIGYAATGKGGMHANVDLQELSAFLGRDTMDFGAGYGLRFSERGDDKSKNTLDVDLSMGDGTLRVSSSGLALDAITSLEAGTKLDVGKTMVGPFKAELKWPTKAGEPAPKPGDTPPAESSRFCFEVASLEANDVWQITETSMMGAGKVVFGKLAVDAVVAPGNLERPTSSAEGMSILMRQVTDTLMRFIKGLNLTNPSPEAVASHFGTAAAAGMTVKASLDKLEVFDISTSQKGGEHIGKLTIGPSEVKVEQDKMSTLLGTKIAELTQQIAEASRATDPDAAQRAADLASKKAELDKRLETVHGLEAEYATLLARQKDPKGGLTPTEYERFKQLQQMVTVSKLGFEVGPVHLEGVHTASAKAESLDLGKLTGSLVATGDTTGKSDRPELEGGLQVASFAGRNVEIPAATRLEVLDGRIAAIEAKAAAGKATQDELQDHAKWVALAKQIHALVVERDALLLGGEPKNGRTLEVVKADLADWVTRAEPQHVGEVSLVGKEGAPALSLGISSAEGGTISLKTGTFDATIAQTESIRHRLERRRDELKAVAAPNPQQQDELADLEKRLAEYTGLATEYAAFEADVKQQRTALQAAKQKASGKKPPVDFTAQDVALSEKDTKLAGLKSKLDAWNQTQGGSLHTEGISTTLKGVGSLGELMKFDPTLRPLTVEVDIPNLTLANLAFAAEPTTFKGDAVSIKNVRVRLHVEVQKTKTAVKDPRPGEPAFVESYGLKSGTLQAFDVGELSAQKLDIRFPIGTEILHLNVPAASIRGVEVRDIPLVGFNPLDFKGSVKADAFEVAFQADLSKAVADPKQGLASYFKTHGHLSAAGIRLGEFEKGKIKFGFDQVKLEDFGVEGGKDTPKDSLAGALKGIGATVQKAVVSKASVELDKASGALSFGVAIDDFKLSNVTYAAAGSGVSLGSASATGGNLEGQAMLDLEALTLLNASLPEDATTEQKVADVKAKEAASAKLLKSAKISLLKFARIEGTKLHYHGKSKGSDTQLDLEKGWLQGLALRDFDLFDQSFKLRLDKAGIEGLSATLQSDVVNFYKTKVGSSLTKLSQVGGSVGGVEIENDSQGKVSWDVATGKASGKATSEAYDAKGKLTSKTTSEFGGSLSGVQGGMSPNGNVTTHIEKVNGSATVNLVAGGSIMAITLTGNATGIHLGYKKASGELTLRVKTGTIGLKGSYVTGPGMVVILDMSVTASVSELKYSEKGFALKMKVPSASLNPGMRAFLPGPNPTGVEFVGGATATGTEIDICGEFFPPQEAAQRAAHTYAVVDQDGKKTPTSLNTLKSLTVNTIRVPKVAVGMLKASVFTPSGPLIVNVPSANLSDLLIKNLRMADDKGTLAMLGGKITTGKIDTTSVTATMGDSMSAFLAQAGLKGGISVDLLQGGGTKVSMTELYAGALHLVAGGKKLGGTAGLAEVKAASIEATRINDQLGITIKDSKARLGATAHGSEITTGPTEAQAGKVGETGTDFKVSLSKKLTGHFMINFPWKNRDGLPVRVDAKPDGRLHVGEIPLPDGFFVVGVWGLDKLVWQRLPQSFRDRFNHASQQAVAKVIDWILQKCTDWTNVEKILNEKLKNLVDEKQAQAAEKGKRYAFEDLKKSIEESWSGLDEVVDALAPGGKGILGTLADEIDKSVHIFDSAEDDRLQELADRKRRFDLLYKWLCGIGISTDLSAAGTIKGYQYPVKVKDPSAKKKEYVPVGAKKEWLHAVSSFHVWGGGTMAGLELGMKATVQEFKMNLGAMTVEGKGARMDATASGGTNNLDSAQAGAGVSLASEFLKVGMDLSQPPADPKERAQWEKEKARAAANKKAQQAAWQEYEKHRAGGTKTKVPAVG
jgi:hypothetical protein